MRLEVDENAPSGKEGIPPRFLRENILDVVQVRDGEKAVLSAELLEGDRQSILYFPTIFSSFLFILVNDFDVFRI